MQISLHISGTACREVSVHVEELVRYYTGPGNAVIWTCLFKTTSGGIWSIG